VKPFVKDAASTTTKGHAMNNLEMKNRAEIENAPLERLMDESAVAELLAVTPATMRLWRHRGRGPAYIKVGGLVRYAPGDLQTFIQRNTHTATCQHRRG